MDDPVNPGHYRHPSGVECITITEHENFCIGNAIKYLWRADHKGHPIEDLRKARWYVDREIARRTGGVQLSDFRSLIAAVLIDHPDRADGTCHLAGEGEGFDTQHEWAEHVADVAIRAMSRFYEDSLQSTTFAAIRALEERRRGSSDESASSPLLSEDDVALMADAVIAELGIRIAAELGDGVTDLLEGTE
jgi:hypothetical protein